ncbi:DUF397 domain-containing protein [Streptomyces ziwulingensis]
MRDCKDRTGPALVVPTAAWASFVGLMLSDDAVPGRLDRQ